MPPASRITDMTLHGGVVITGSSNVFIGFLPAARVSDHHVCPQHIGGPIEKGSPTVLINGLQAARIGDRLACAGPGEEPSIEGTIGHEHEFDRAKEKPLKKFGEQKEDDDRALQAEIKKTWAEDSGELDTFWGDHGKLVHGEYSVSTTAGAEINGLRDFKAGLAADVEGKYSTVNVEGEYTGALGKIEGTGDVLTADGNLNVGATIDTKKGEGNIGVDAGAGAAVFKGEVAVESKGLKIPFLGIEIGGRLGVEGTLLGVEARAHAGVSYTKKDGFRAGAGGKISAFLAGLGINFEIFIRPIKDTSAPPDTLATGYPTVLIGPAANTAPLFSDEYLAGLVGKHIAGADSPELKAAMDTLWKHRHDPDNPLVADALVTIAALRGKPLTQIQADWRTYQAALAQQEHLAAAKGLEDIPGIKTWLHPDFMGSTSQLRSGQVVGDALGMDPVFGALLNPTGGLVGPGNAAVDGNDSAIGYHGAVHDAGGYLYNYHDMGPGYDYLGREGRDTSSPLSGQRAGIEYWREQLPDRSFGQRTSDAVGNTVMDGVVGGVDAVSDAYETAKDAASDMWDYLWD